LGVEVGEGEVKIAAQNAAKNSAFMHAKISPAIVDQMPQWDAILILSVAHRIYAHEGERQMFDVISACAGKTRNIFFEGSTRHGRYVDMGAPAPGFKDLNVDSCDEWHQKLFKDALGENWIVADKRILTQSKLEPMRITYHLKNET
jgi:hypothetical protein